MAEDAGLDIDMDAELARIQGAVAGVPGAEVIMPGRVLPGARAVEFMGERFRIADKIGLMPLLKFSAYADMDTGDARALAAMYSMLKDCIHAGNPGCGKCQYCAPDRCGQCRSCLMVADGEGAGEDLPCVRNRPDPSGCKDYDPGDWHAFEQHAIDSKADADDLMAVITQTIEKISGRPTQQPASSSPGRRSTRAGSTGRSSARRGGGSRR